MNPIELLGNHPFWALLTLAVLIWYSSVTVYVAIRGGRDIKHMLRTLAAQHGDAEPSPDDTGSGISN